jgi:hypothetical protein
MSMEPGSIRLQDGLGKSRKRGRRLLVDLTHDTPQCYFADGLAFDSCLDLEAAVYLVRDVQRGAHKNILAYLWFEGTFYRFPNFWDETFLCTHSQ